METAPKPKGMCIATRCTSIDHFVEMFHRFVDEDSFFVSTVNTRPAGLETSFSVTLTDGTPVLQGLCVVLQAWTTERSPFKTPGVRLGIKRLTAASMPVFQRLVATRSRPTLPPPIVRGALAEGTVVPRPSASIEIPKVPQVAVRSATVSEVDALLPPLTPSKPPPPPTVAETPPAAAATTTTTTSTPPATRAEETRTPGSELVLPANPLMNLSDASLEGYVDCTLYEETGTFFPAEDDVSFGEHTSGVTPVPAEPPVLAPRPVAQGASPVEIIADEPPPAAAPLPDYVFASRDSAPSGELAIPARAAVAATNAAARRPWAYAAGGAIAAGAIAAWVVAWTSRGDEPAPPASHQVTSASRPATNDVRNDVRNDVAPSPAAPIGAPATRLEPAVVEPAPDPSPAPVAPLAPVPVSPAEDLQDSADALPMPMIDESSAPFAGEGPCKVSVTSTPAGSIVHLDGARVAPSPITIATECGRHKLEIKHPRYQLATKLVNLVQDTPGAIDVTLQRPTHAVVVTSQPSGATVFIDGKRAGTTPTTLSVLGFTNLRIEIKKTGFAPMQAKLYSKTAQDRLSVKLTKW